VLAREKNWYCAVGTNDFFTNLLCMFPPSLGGWLVLEPWITPSLFYQFLGKNEINTAFDISSFCRVLGPTEANKQLRRHWDTWVTEDIIKQLADSEAVNSLRLPVGDYMYKPYGDYSKYS
jgi:glucan 1,3-beta-glucosidase